MFKTFSTLAVIAIVLAASLHEANAQTPGGPIVTTSSTIGIGSNETIFLSVEDSLQRAIDGISFVLVVNDGGATLGGASTDPAIVNVSSAGLSTGSVTSFADVDGDVTTPTFPELAVVGTFAGFNATLNNTPDIFAAVSFDTSGLSPGDTFDLNLTGPGNISLFSNVGTTINLDFATPFVITAIPEPSSAALLVSFGALALLRRKRI